MMRNKEEVVFLLLRLNRAQDEMIEAGDSVEIIRTIRVQISTLNWLLGADNETQEFINYVKTHEASEAAVTIPEESEGSYADSAVKQIIRLTELFEYEKAMAAQKARAACLS